MKTTLITSALFAAVAMAGVNVQEFSTSGNSAKFLQKRSIPCQNNDDCTGFCASLTVSAPAVGAAGGHCAADGQEDYCNPDTNHCFCVIQNPGKVCDCVLGDMFGPLSDSCLRGGLTTGTGYCIYDCEDGAPGNGGCNAEDDPCKAP